MPSPIKALLWDIDGVLVDTEELHFRSWNWFLSTMKVGELTREEYLPLIGRSGRDNMQTICQMRNIAGNIDDLIKVRRSEYERLRLEGVPVIRKNVELARAFADLFLGLRFAAVSSASRTDIDSNLEAAGLVNFFEQAVSFTDRKELKRKPAPDLYLLTLEKMSLDADACIAFEDSQSGIESATNAGIRVVALPNLLTAHHDFSKARLVIAQEESIHPLNILARVI